MDLVPFQLVTFFLLVQWSSNRGTTLIPTAEPDNNAFGFYPTAGGATGGYGGFWRSWYADRNEAQIYE